VTLRTAAISAGVLHSLQKSRILAISGGMVAVVAVA
jgi:hypothetical protein